MIEHFTEALVLDREPKNELDANLILYTKELGKISAIVKSLRKITSKLSGHLVPGNLVQARIVGENNFQLVDALSLRVPPAPELFKFLRFIQMMTPFNSPDLSFWYEVQEAVKNNNFSKSTYRRLLQTLGYDAKFAKCDSCRKNKVAYFVANDIIFLCSVCLTKLNYPQDGVFEI